MNLRYSAGNPNAPGNAFGRVELDISADGRAHLEQILPGGQHRRASEAQVDPAVLARLRAALVASGFPAVARHPLVAGTTLRELRVQSDGVQHAVQLGWFEARQMPGYGELFSVLDSLVRAMSGEGWRAAPNLLEPGAVTGITPLQR